MNITRINANTDIMRLAESAKATQKRFVNAIRQHQDAQRQMNKAMTATYTDIIAIEDKLRSMQEEIDRTGKQGQDEQRILYHAMRATDIEAFYLPDGGIVKINPENQRVIFED